MNIAAVIAGRLVLEISRAAAERVIFKAFHPWLFAVRRLVVLRTAMMVHQGLHPLLIALANGQFTKVML